MWLAPDMSLVIISESVGRRESWNIQTLLLLIFEYAKESCCLGMLIRPAKAHALFMLEYTMEFSFFFFLSDTHVLDLSH